MKRSIFAVLLASSTVFLSSETTLAGERYVGLDFVVSNTDDEFGGTNTLGGFSNSDDRNNTPLGFSLTFGVRDAYTIGGIRVTPELELAWFEEFSTTSASFLGAPNPLLLYNTSIQTGRLGGNFWWPIYESGLWRAEAGLGAGIVYREVSVTDTVVAGSSDDITGYGQVGFRALRAVGPNGNIKLGVNYVLTGETDTDIAVPGGGPAAGDYTVDTRSLEVRLGYEFKLN